MSPKRYTSIFFALSLLFALPVQAQMNLDLLENSPTPTPLPLSQEYILEIKPISTSEEVRKSVLTPAEQELFDTQGYVVTNSSSSIGLMLEKTQITFEPFLEAFSADESTYMTIATSDSSGYQLILEAQTPFAASHGSQIMPTSCDVEKPCTVNRAAEWNLRTPSGWGYTQDGKHFRPAPFEPKMILMNQQSSHIDRKNIQFRVVADDLPEGIYSSTMLFLLLPY